MNFKEYVGQTNNPELRWSQHKHYAKHADQPNSQVISRAIAKYGVENFEFKVVASFESQEETNIEEEKWIQMLDTRNPLKGYNVDIGGRVAPRTPEVCKNISAGLKRHYETHESKLKGRKHSEESKKKMSESAMGKAGTNTGKKFDPEWKVKISQAQVGQERQDLKRFTDEVEKEICRLYVEEKKSTYAIGEQLQCQRTTIADILKRCRIETRQSNYTGHSNGCNKFTKEQELEICQEYKQGKISRTELAKKFNCGKTTMRDILMKHNVLLKRNI